MTDEKKQTMDESLLDTLLAEISTKGQQGLGKQALIELSKALLPGDIVHLLPDKDLEDLGRKQMEINEAMSEMTNLVGAVRGLTEKMKVTAGLVNRTVNDMGDYMSRLMEKIGETKAKALIDPLTGLYNRGFFERKKIELIDLLKDPNIQVAVLNLDLNNFKQVNDSLGHDAGDVILKGVAEILTNQTSNGVDYCIRTGGDEFVVLLVSLEDKQPLTPDLAMLRARQIAETIRLSSFMNEGAPIGQDVTTCIGVTMLTDPDNLDKDFSHADRAMYAAKALKNEDPSQSHCILWTEDIGSC